VVHTQGPDIRRGKHGEYLNDNADASKLDEDEALAIATALALYCHNIFSALSAISANVIDIQQWDAVLGSEIVQRLQVTARKLKTTILETATWIMCF
jgi:hypothetical protein